MSLKSKHLPLLPTNMALGLWDLNYKQRWPRCRIWIKGHHGKRISDVAKPPTRMYIFVPKVGVPWDDCLTYRNLYNLSQIPYLSPGFTKVPCAELMTSEVPGDILFFAELASRSICVPETQFGWWRTGSRVMTHPGSLPSRC